MADATSKILYALSSSPSTLQHSVRVAHIAGEIAAKLGLPRTKGFWLAGLAHDLGKLTWPDELHEKVGLTGFDWALIHAHPLQSVDYLKGIIPKIDSLIVDAVLHHHERPDGTGYPEGVEPSLPALVIAVADCWEALTASRPYRKQPFTPAKALNELEKWAPSMMLDVLAVVRMR